MIAVKPCGAEANQSACRALLAILALLQALAAAGSSRAADKYQLIGKIENPSGMPLATERAVIFLQGAMRPYSAETEAGPGGRM